MTPFNIARETLRLSSDVTILAVDARAVRETVSRSPLSLLMDSSFRVPVLSSV